MRTAELDRKQRDFMLRRSDILKAAERVFADRGYHKATMSNIAEEAQYGVGTIYLYFKDKQSLYASLLEEKTGDLLHLVQEKVEKTNDVFGKISVLVKTYLEFFANNENFFRIYFSERGDLRSKFKVEVPASCINLIIEFLNYTASLIEQAQSKGILTRRYPARKIAFALLSIIRASIIPRLMDLKKEKEEEDILDQCSFVLDAFFHGLGINR